MPDQPVTPPLQDWTEAEIKAQAEKQRVLAKFHLSMEWSKDGDIRHHKDRAEDFTRNAAMLDAFAALKQAHQSLFEQMLVMSNKLVNDVPKLEAEIERLKHLALIDGKVETDFAMQIQKLEDRVGATELERDQLRERAERAERDLSAAENHDAQNCEWFKLLQAERAELAALKGQEPIRLLQLVGNAPDRERLLDAKDEVRRFLVRGHHPKEDAT